MTNKTSQKDYYDSFGDFDAIELGVVDGSENEYRKRFIARRAEKMAKIAGLDDESTVLELGCGTGICSTHWVKSSIKFYGLGLFSEVGIRVERKIFMGFVPHQIIPAGGCEIFYVYGGFGKGAGKDSVGKSVGGVIVICGAK